MLYAWPWLTQNFSKKLFSVLGCALTTCPLVPLCKWLLLGVIELIFNFPIICTFKMDRWQKRTIHAALICVILFDDVGDWWDVWMPLKCLNMMVLGDTEKLLKTVAVVSVSSHIWTLILHLWHIKSYMFWHRVATHKESLQQRYWDQRANSGSAPPYGND
jgi:hypothetical protein